MLPPGQVKMRVPLMSPKASLCDALDTLLDKGVVVMGELTIKVADIELLYLGIELVACSWETMRQLKEPTATQAFQIPSRDREGAVRPLAYARGSESGKPVLPAKEGASHGATAGF